MPERLSDRQIECVLLAQRMTGKEIARRLDISHHTVSAHIREAMRRLEVTTRKAAIRALAADPKYASHVTPDRPGSRPFEVGQTDGSGGDGAKGGHQAYPRRGRWRTPPKWLVGVAVIFGWTVVGLILLSALLGLTLTVITAADRLALSFLERTAQ